jgi:hypothetical protein
MSEREQRLRELGDKLAQLYTPEETMVWLFSPHKLLDDNVPALAIMRGQIDALSRLLDQIREGTYI